MDVPGDWPNRQYSRRVRAGGLDWHLQQAGERGPQVLLLHGAGASTHSWAGLLPLLAAHCQVLAVDLPGHAWTRGAATKHLSLPGMAAAVAALLSALDLRPALLVGHSAGAAVSVRLCLDGAVQPRAIAAINGALLPLDGLMGQIFPRVARLCAAVPGLPRLVATRARRTPLMDPMIAQTGSPPQAVQLAQYRQLSAMPSHVAGTLQMMAQWDLPAFEPELGRLATPLHLFACSHDRAVPAAQARYLAARLDVAQLHMMPGLGHLGHEEAPQRFATALLALLDEPAARA